MSIPESGQVLPGQSNDPLMDPPTPPTPPTPPNHHHHHHHRNLLKNQAQNTVSYRCYSRCYCGSVDDTGGVQTTNTPSQTYIDTS